MAEDGVYHIMDQIIPGLWVGDMSAAVAADQQEQHNIKFIISAMRGRVKVNPLVRKHQIPLDDLPSADVLEHIPACNALIETALSRNESVLVHCQAGMSRSVTIVAGFLMYSQNLDRDAALDLIRRARPSIDPNDGFMEQLDIYHSASFKVSRGNKNVRAFYLDRSTKEVLNGDGSEVRTDMFAGFPRTPSASTPTTPGTVPPLRRIRCKMCRRELAAREHMMDHGQLSPPTPAAISRTGSRHSSLGESARGPHSAIMGGLKMSTIGSDETPSHELSRSRHSSRSGSFGESSRAAVLGGLTMSSITSEGQVSKRRNSQSTRSTSFSEHTKPSVPRPFSGTRVDPAEDSAVVDSDSEPEDPEEKPDEQGTTAPKPSGRSPLPSPSILLSPREISSQLPPSLADLRRSSLMDALRNASSPIAPSMSRSNSSSRANAPLPIIINPKCSGYFLEPMKWMDAFLCDGNMAGKITCPNDKCKAKLGNYDWAGVECGCHEWVTPGFCISKSKVDEIY